MKTFLLSLALTLLSLNSTAATVTGTLTGGGGTDDMTLVVQPANGKAIEAYCGDQCGDWFDQDEATEVFQVKPALIGKKIQMTYEKEPNRDRVAGPDSNEPLLFIKRVQILK